MTISSNPVLFAVIVYALATVIAMMVAGVIMLIRWVVSFGGGGQAAKKE